jgi:hypothetical protein
MWPPTDSKSVYTLSEAQALSLLLTYFQFHHVLSLDHLPLTQYAQFHKRLAYFMGKYYMWINSMSNQNNLVAKFS